MDIREQPNENYIVSKINMTCDNHSTDIDQRVLIPRNGFYVLSGSAGSGKTNLLVYLLGHRKDKGFNNKFDRVYYLSPSFDTIGKDIGLAEERIYTEFNADILQGIMDQERVLRDEAKENDEEPAQVLYIFDDLIVELKKKENLNMLMKLIYNRRHNNAYIIICTQKYNALPLKLRVSLANKGALIIFKCQKKELKSVHDDLIDMEGKDFKQLCDYCFDDRYNFLYIRFDKQIERGCYKNFNQLTLTFKDDGEF